MNRTGVVLLCVVGLAAGNSAKADEKALREALLFHASFDGGVDAAFAKGDKRIYTATSYGKREDTKPGLHHPDIVAAPGKGRFGDALQFRQKNTKAVFYQAANNLNFSNGKWSGTISFWLNLDPDRDLAPGFCDPIQITDEAYNDAAIWVDFTKDDKPRHFRLGVFGDLKSWNPKGIEADKNPAFLQRLIVVSKPPFRRGTWTHVVITHSGLGSGSGEASLYLDGQLQGKTETIPESFTWDMSRAAIRVGVNYVGLFDELAVFDRPLSAADVKALGELKGGVRSLHR